MTEQIQKNYLDYRNLGDTGIDVSASVQPIQTNEAAIPVVTNRPTENLRSRTEISRSVLDDLLYYRDRAYPYHISLTGGGVLAWGGTVALAGTGILNATTALALRPMLTPQVKKRCSLVTGVSGTNEVTYGEPSSPDATHGTNQFTIEHRDVPGTVSLTAAVTDGPIYRIIVVFDSTNNAHDAVAAAAAVNTLMVPPIPPFGVIGFDTGTAIAALAETPIDIREHDVGTSGNANAQAEAHTLIANAISAFTTSTPLVEGDVLAIRYDYVIEPDGGDPDDPKGGIPGGRAESSIARGNSDVGANLFILASKPEWAPGAIPLCKIVNNVARWIDGTNVTAGSTATPGTSAGSSINASGFQGPPTLIVAGGLLTSNTTPQTVADTTDARLGQLRSVTRTCSTSPYSTGGFYDGNTAIQDALDELTGASLGGHLYIRRGTNYFAIDGTQTAGDLLIEGEVRDETQMTVVNAVFGSCTFANSLTLRRLTVSRSTGAALGLLNDLTIEDCVVDVGLIAASSSGKRVNLRNVTLNPVSQASGPISAGIVCSTRSVYIENCELAGPDALVSGGAAASLNGDRVTVLGTRFRSLTSSSTTISAGGVSDGSTVLFKNCFFDQEVSTSEYPYVQAGGTPAEITFENCVFRNLSDAARLAYVNPALDQHVRLIGCTFIQETATPLAAGVAVFVLNGAAACRITVRDCTIVTQGGVDTGATFPLIVLGSDATGAAASNARLDIDGLKIECINDATSRLHSGPTLKIFQNPDGTSSIRNVCLSLNGLRKHSGSSPVVQAVGYSPTQPLFLDNFTVEGVDYPDAVIASSLLDFDKVHARSLTVRAVGSPDVAGYFSANVYDFMNSRISDAELALFRADDGGGSAALSIDANLELSGGGKSMFQGILTQYADGDDTKKAFVFVGRAMLHDTKFPAANVAANTGAVVLGGASIFHDNYVFVSVDDVVGVDFNSTGGNDVQGNTLVFTVNAPFSTAFGTITGAYSSIVGNRVLNIGSDVPGLPSGTGTTIVANNVAANSVGLY